MRIITGVAKGRRLRAPQTNSTRPATDRVREAVFSAIGPWVEGSTVLDLYAGSGSYGLEALSRGATEGVFVESGRRALEALRHNITTVGLGGIVIASPVGDFLAAPGRRRYQLVFADPPWDLATAELDENLSRIDEILEPDGEVVVSRRQGDVAPAIVAGWSVATDRRYGDARIYRYVKATLRQSSRS